MKPLPPLFAPDKAWARADVLRGAFPEPLRPSLPFPVFGAEGLLWCVWLSPHEQDAERGVLRLGAPTYLLSLRADFGDLDGLSGVPEGSLGLTPSGEGPLDWRARRRPRAGGPAGPVHGPPRRSSAELRRRPTQPHPAHQTRRQGAGRPLPGGRRAPPAACLSAGRDPLLPLARLREHGLSMSAPRDDIDSLLRRHKACPEALPWASGFATWEELWHACEAPDWLLWGLDALGFQGETKLRLFAAACAERARPLWDTPEGAEAVAVARRFAEGKASRSELVAARDAATAARAALPERTDTTEARLAAASAAIACLRDLAMDAAMDASRESARVAYWEPDIPGSWPEEGKWQANELRRILGRDIDAFIEDVRRRERGRLRVL